MDKIKTILIVIVLIFAAIGIILTAGFLYSLLQLLLLVGVVGLAGYIGIRLLTNKSPGDVVVMTVLRGDQRVDVNVTLDKRP